VLRAGQPRACDHDAEADLDELEADDVQLAEVRYRVERDAPPDAVEESAEADIVV